MARRLTRLFKARELQKDEAVERLERERERLERLAQAHVQATLEQRAQLQSRVGKALSVLELQLFEASQRAGERAQELARHEVAAASQRALDCHVRLRQIEILRERQREQARQEQARREQQQIEALRRGRGPLTFVLVPLLAVALDAGCKPQDAPAAPTPVPAAAAAATREKVCAEEQFSAEEVRLLTKLRARAEALQQKELQLSQRERAIEAKLADVAKAEAASKPAPASQPVKRAKAEGVQAQGAAPEKKDATQAAGKPQVAGLVQVVQRMSSRAAGAMLGSAQPDTAASVLMRLDAAAAAQILGQMAPEQAARVAEQIEQRKAEASSAQAARADLSNEHASSEGAAQ